MTAGAWRSVFTQGTAVTYLAWAAMETACLKSHLMGGNLAFWMRKDGEKSGGEIKAWWRECTRSFRRASSQADSSIALRSMWQKGAFWLTASVKADLKCLDLADLKYTIAFWAVALTSTACSTTEAHYSGSNDVKDSPSRLLIQRFSSCTD